MELEFEFLCGIGKEDEQFKKASQREEKKGDGLDVRTTPVRSSTRLNGSQGKLKAENQEEANIKFRNKQLDPTR